MFASQLVENEKTVLKTTISYLIDNKKMDEAKEITRRYMATHSTDGEIYRIDGLVNYLDKDYPSAISSFNKAASLTVDEQQAINLYLLAKSQAKAQQYPNVYVSLDRMEEIPGTEAYVQNARDQFNRDKTLPEFNVALLIVQNPTLSLRKTKEAPPPEEKNYTLLGEGIYGYDSNPIFIQDDSPTRNEAKSTFYSVKVGGTYKLKPSIGLLNNKLSVGYTSYQKEIAKAFNNLSIVYQLNWNPSYGFLYNQKITFRYKLERSYAAPKKVRYYYTGNSLEINKEFEPVGNNKFNVALPIGYRTYGNQDLDSKENDRSGLSYGIKGGHKYQGDAWAWLNTLAYNAQNTVGKKFNTRGLDFISNVQKILPWEFEGLVGLNYGLLTYTNFPDKRTDQNMGFSLELSHDVKWVKGMESALSFSSIKNRSTAQESNFSQNVILLRISYEG